MLALNHITVFGCFFFAWNFPRRGSKLYPLLDRGQAAHNDGVASR